MDTVFLGEVFVASGVAQPHSKQEKGYPTPINISVSTLFCIDNSSRVNSNGISMRLYV